MANRPLTRLIPSTRMEELAERSRRLPDARVRWLVDWIRREMCPRLPPLGTPSTGAPVEWLPRRVVIFTEYADTKRYLEQQLKVAIGTANRTKTVSQPFMVGCRTSCVNR